MQKIRNRRIGSYLAPTLLVSALAGCLLSGCRAQIQPSTTIAVGKGPDAIYPTADGRYLYVANVEDTKISVIELETNSVASEIKVALGPWGFARLPGGRVAASSWEGEVNIIDEKEGTLLSSHKTKSHLGGIVPALNGKSVFVVGVDADRVFRMEVQSGRIIQEIATGAGPDGIGLGNGGKDLYVACTKSGTIEIFSTESGTKIESFEVGGKPELIHATHDLKTLYISNFHRGLVHIIDTTDRKIVHEIEGIEGPEEAVPDESKRILYVAAFNAQKILAYDLDSLEKLPVEYATGSKPIGVLSVGNRLFVTNYGDNSVGRYLME
jgi:YVTN family beta-propeller protein